MSEQPQSPVSTQNDASIPQHAEENGVVSPTPAVESAALEKASAAQTSSIQPAKKFTALNVNKMFLEKASPNASPSTTHASPVIAPKPAASAAPGQSSEFACLTASTHLDSKLLNL